MSILSLRNATGIYIRVIAEGFWYMPDRKAWQEPRYYVQGPALRTGAGLVRVSVPEELFPILQVGVPEATCITRERLFEDLMQYSAIAIGPGLGDEIENGKLIKKILYTTDKPVVIDADGLNLLRDDLDAMKNAKAKVIITPHPGEAARLLNRNASEINRDRQKSAAELAAVTGAVTVLKGAGSVVATPEGKTIY